MKYGYETYQMEVEGHLFWVAKSKDLNGCVGQGESLDEAVSELEQNEQDWIDAALEYNIPIPDSSVMTESNFSGKLSLRISSFVHEQIASLAKKEGVSINQYVNDAISYYNGLHKGKSLSQNVVPTNSSYQFEASIPTPKKSNIIGFDLKRKEM